MAKPLIGFIGQGFIGKSYADDLEKRGYNVVRYALEAPYRANKDTIKECDIVFIAVPTPTTSKGFDDSIVRGALGIIGAGTTVVIKSTLLPGTTKKLQKRFPRLYVMHSPEFLVARNAKRDAAKPLRNIVGIPKHTAAYKTRANELLRILPKAPFSLVCTSEEAELIKYAGNLVLYLKVLFANLLYDAARSVGADYEVIRKAVAADPRIGPSHLQIMHESGHKGARSGRGAGGLCFIKDIEALSRFYATNAHDPAGSKLFDAMIAKNIQLLRSSRKDLELLRATYGPKILRKKASNKRKRRR